MNAREVLKKRCRPVMQTVGGLDLVEHGAAKVGTAPLQSLHLHKRMQPLHAGHNSPFFCVFATGIMGAHASSQVLCRFVRLLG
jgi:hypothetical protein